MSNLASYSPEDITVLVAGVLPLTGFVSGNFVNISKDIQPLSSTRTSDGEVARLYNNDQTFTITITLHNTAESNEVLTKLWLLDEITQRGKFPLLIKDQLGSSLFFSATSWIEGIPDTTYGSEITERTWTIRSSQAVINIGGNASASSLIEDLLNTVTAAVPILEGIL